MTWIRANLKVNVPIYLWDKCLEVISSATHWEEIISEWSVSIQTTKNGFDPGPFCFHFDTMIGMRPLCPMVILPPVTLFPPKVSSLHTKVTSLYAISQVYICLQDCICLTDVIRP